ncbi:MAG TPA: carboxypeptidase regulatory-like domain-containing protein [Terriglobia bacterium]|nr:carboxypeptidase regulatory-like domain-containing protein [Terriglobia bacterium]
MRIRFFEAWRLILLAALVSLFAGGRLSAQSSSGTLRGQVVDPSGAAIPGATVSVSGPDGYKAAAETNGSGNYQIKGLVPGAYTIRATAPNFSTFTQANVVVAAGHVHNVKISLSIKHQVQQVTVTGQATHLSVSPENNANQLVLRGSALQALSDDPDELLAQLNAMAGPAAGPNGAQIYIDGFTGGQLPPKSDILEIHINQNPFSAEYDKVGYGRIEITTKPGASQFHGEFFADGNDSPFNSRSPFAPVEPPYYSDFLMGSVGGPINQKASFFFDIFYRDINDNSVISAVTLNPNLQEVPFSQALANPRSRWVISPRVDLQITPKNLLAVRYQLWRDNEVNDGLGQFDLPSQAYNLREQESTLELNDTQVISARTVNQTRFEYRYDTSNQAPSTLTPALDVLGSFTAGGNPQGTILDNQNYFELQDIATMSLGKHTVIYGGRFRDDDENYSSSENFNGTFTFPTLQAYALTEQGLAQGLPFPQIQAEGGGPSQFFITTGVPSARANMVEGSAYTEDQWRIRPNLSLSLGGRFETQNYISDHADFAPRLGFAWGIGRRKPPKTVLRAGFGIFYDRFEEQQVLEAEQLNGINQRQFTVTNPAFFPTVPSISTLTGLSSGGAAATVYDIDPSLRTPYTIQSAVGLERQFTKGLTASVTYLNSHGLHQLYTRNINTPGLGLYNPSDPAYGRPFNSVSACSVVPAISDCEAGFDGNIYQFESDGLYNQNEMIANFRYNQGPYLSLFGFYMLNYANSNTSGVTYYPSNPYDVMEDYGRAVFDIRDRAVVGGAINLPFGLRLLPFFVADSGTPFNITLGQDLLGTSIFDQRPAFAAPGATGPNIVATSLGVFNTSPAIGEALVPVNYGTGPGEYSLNVHFEKTFSFGKEEGRHHGFGGGFHGHGPGGLGARGLSSGGGPGFWRPASSGKYNLTLGVAVHNIFNTVNLGTPDGNLGSPLFGKSNSLAQGPFSSQSANREIDFQIRFTF